jgi:hypothetical protein
LIAFIMAATPATKGVDALVPPNVWGTSTPIACAIGKGPNGPTLGGYDMTGILVGAKTVTRAPKFEKDVGVNAAGASDTAPTQITWSSMQGWTKLGDPTS